VRLLPGNDKIRRVYARLLVNLGVEVQTRLLEFTRPASDYAIEAVMTLLKEPYQDEEAVTAYYADPAFILNNLGEGVYGWMKRQDRRGGFIHVPGSAGRTCYLSVFVDSEINRDPSRRATLELPTAASCQTCSST